MNFFEEINFIHRTFENFFRLVKMTFGLAHPALCTFFILKIQLGGRSSGFGNPGRGMGGRGRGGGGGSKNHAIPSGKLEN